MMSRLDELKKLVRTSPTVEATFAEIDGEYQRKVSELNALKPRRDALQSQLTAISAAKAEIESTGEPVPDPAPAAKPKLQGNKK